MELLFDIVFSDFVSGLGWGFLLTMFVLKRYYKIERKHPYYWSCPVEGCGFRVSSNVYSPVVLRMAEDHERTSHQEEL